MITEDQLRHKAAALLERCKVRHVMMASAESCTGGLVAGFLTDIAGSSAVFERGFVTYSNAAKTEMLGVPAELIDTHGAVSELVARAMADGAIRHSRADIAIAITGVAGPSGGTVDKPVGLVHFAATHRGGATSHVERRLGNIGRRQVRLESVAVALQMLDGVLA